MLLPVGLVVQFTVPQAVTQVLAVMPVMLHVEPIGQFASVRHCTQLSAGSIDIAFTRVSQTLFNVSTAQSASVRQSTQRLFAVSQMLLPVGFGVQVIMPHVTPASGVTTPPSLPAEPLDPDAPAVPPVVPPPLPPDPVAPAVPPVPPVPAVPVEVVVESSPPHAT
jgi:hypothetical protein